MACTIVSILHAYRSYLGDETQGLKVLRDNYKDILLVSFGYKLQNSQFKSDALR